MINPKTGQPLMRLVVHGYYPEHNTYLPMNERDLRIQIINLAQDGGYQLLYSINDMTEAHWGKSSYFAVVDGVNIYVSPRNPKGYRKHRCYVDCPKCGKSLSFGRFDQHWRHSHGQQ